MAPWLSWRAAVTVTLLGALLGPLVPAAATRASAQRPADLSAGRYDRCQVRRFTPRLATRIGKCGSRRLVPTHLWHAQWRRDLDQRSAPGFGGGGADTFGFR
jgi:hypothetical protein